MCVLMESRPLMALALALPAAGFLVRLFIIQHDCAHGSFFPSRVANETLGTLLGVLTLTPHQYWTRTHALHHAGSGNLDERGWGDIDTLTVREYLRLNRWRRLAYRLCRHPLVLFGIGPSFHFVIKHRLPWIVPAAWRRERASILATDLALLALLALALATIGLPRVLLVQAPITAISGACGVWLFYVQHQFERAYWRPGRDWSFEAAGLSGSSYYALPRPLQWLTGSIGLHHIHHLSPRVPSYRLQACLEQTPELRVPPLTLRASLRCAGLALWDETAGVLVSFAELGTRRTAAREAA
jgi:omega-6 fatty acid desaturase (delta-12 desaturase)